MSLPIIDIHVHLTGIGQGGTGCRLSAAKFRSPLTRIMRLSLGLFRAHRGGDLDRRYADLLQRELNSAAQAGLLDAAVILP